jgi:hypothetical protein
MVGFQFDHDAVFTWLVACQYDDAAAHRQLADGLGRSLKALRRPDRGCPGLDASRALGGDLVKSAFESAEEFVELFGGYD